MWISIFDGAIQMPWWYIVRSIGGGYTAAVPCRDKKDSSVGPLLKKEKLESIPKEFLKK